MRSTSKLVIVAVAIAVGGLLAGFVARGSMNTKQGVSSAAPVAAVVETPTTAPLPVVVAAKATSSPGVTPIQAARPSSVGQSTGGQSSGTPTTVHPTAPAPVILTFVTPENIDCHNGNFQTFSASWTTKNAVKTTISIDGPGIYKTYPANADESLPFNCSSPHTFLLTAFGSDGATVSRSITLQPRNVQTPSSGDDDL